MDSEALAELREEIRRVDSEALAKLREAVRRGPHRSERHIATYEPALPQIKMIVSDWYTDEFGNQARITQASD